MDRTDKACRRAPAASTFRTSATASSPPLRRTRLAHRHRYGGPVRGFDRLMPSFRDALTSEEIDNVIGYLRGFCRDPRWPLGDLNLPRPLVTDKAYPENEAVATTA